MLTYLARLTLALIFLLAATWLDHALGAGPPASQASAVVLAKASAPDAGQASPALRDCQRLLAAMEESGRSQRQEQLYQLIQHQARRP